MRPSLSEEVVEDVRDATADAFELPDDRVTFQDRLRALIRQHRKLKRQRSDDNDPQPSAQDLRDLDLDGQGTNRRAVGRDRPQFGEGE